ncbi:hypothetical protein [Ciceribacter sp. RN22]|nr:hypothetical protein [Ciceribacter sp. RN22]MCO6177354.1 hypothetical protein [Ciceribacter sp. RN22]
METVKLNDSQKKSRRGRNIALGIVLGIVVVIIYAMSVVKMTGVAQ